jgi:hypothetical protein
MPGVFQLGLIGSCAGEPVANFLQWSTPYTTGTPVGTFLADLFATFQTTMMEQWLGMLPDDYSLDGGQVRGLNVGSSYTYVSSFGDTIGTRGSNSIASGVGPLVVGVPTGAPTAKVLKKIYLPGIAIGDMTGNQFSAGLNTAMAAFLALYTVTMTGANTWTPVVYSKKTSSAYNVIAAYVSVKPALQRRRFLPVGE